MDNIIESPGQPASHERLLTIEEVAAYMQASPRHVANLVRRREIPFIKLGALTRFDLDSVKVALARLTVHAR